MEFKKRGTLYAPVKPVVFEFNCKVDQPMKDASGKMYIFLNIGDAPRNRVHDVHVASNQYLQGKLSNPLEGNVLKVKVPYKYNKVTCKVSGNKALQELVKGDQVNAIIEYCGVWAVNGYCGPSWKLFSLIYP
jgi:hypothetical protein